jgi:hypothetical protein
MHFHSGYQPTLQLGYRKFLGNMIQMVRVAILHYGNFVLKMLAIQNIQDCKWHTQWHSTQTLSRHSLLSKYQTVSRYTCKCNFIYAHKEKTYSPCWANFHETLKCLTALCADLLYQISSQSDNKCGMCGSKFTNVATFTELTITQSIFVNRCCTKFYPYQTKM